MRSYLLRTRHIAALLTAVLSGLAGNLYANNPDATEGVVLSHSILQLEQGKQDTLSAMILPGEILSENAIWKSDDETIATVEGGIVKAIGLGNATITATISGIKAACTVKVRAEGTPISSLMPGMGMPPGGMMQGGDSLQGRPQGMGQNRDGQRGQRGQRGQMGQGMPGGGQMGQGGPGGGQMGQGGPGGQRQQGVPGGGQMGQGGPGGGMPGGGMPGGNMSEESDATDPNGYYQTEGEEVKTGETFSSSTADANAVKVSGGTLTLTDCTLMKEGGNSSNADGSSFYGTNSAVLSSKEGKVIINGGFISTDAIGANGIVAYGGKVEVSDMSISCSNRLSRGIHATGGGEILARNLTISTQESNSSVIALDRGGGTVNVIGGTYNCSGTDCAVMYSTGDLTVNNIQGSSKVGEIGVIEGDNFIAINNSDLVSSAPPSSRGMMILQSGSGDAGTGLNGIITVAGGSLTMTDSQTSLIEIVTNVTGKVTLDGVKLTIPSGILMTVDYNRRWQTYGATGVLVLSGEGTTYDGSIVADEYSSAQLTVNEGVTWQGAYDKANTAKNTTLTIDGGTWNLTADSNVDSIVLKGNATINKNGHTLSCADIKTESGTIND